MSHLLNWHTQNIIAYINFFLLTGVIRKCKIYYVMSYASVNFKLGFPGSSVVKNPTANAGDAGDVGSIPGLGRSPGEGNGKPLQHSWLGNPMDREAWWATVHGVAKESDMT